MNKIAKTDNVILIFDGDNTDIPVGMIYKNGSIHYLKTQEMNLTDQANLWETDVITKSK